MTTTKDQLGARVPKEVRQMAIDDAKARGVSLNVYVEDLIRRAHEPAPQLAAILDDDVAVKLEQAIRDTERALARDEPAGEYAATSTIVHAFEPTDRIVTNVETVPAPDVLVEFARNCRNGTLHWKSGPGNPCKYCGGEI